MSVELDELKAKIDEAIELNGISLEKKTYNPHKTNWLLAQNSGFVAVKAMITNVENKPRGREVKVLTMVNSITGRSFRILPRGSAKTLKLFTDDEIKLALENMMTDSWHAEHIGSFASGYIMRPETIDKFVTMKKQKRFA